MLSVKPSFDNPNFVDLFCGAGGFSLGFEMAGFRSIFAIDKHPDPIKTYCQNRPEILKNHGIFTGNICEISGKNILKTLSKLESVKSEIDVIIGGPPCQGFSRRGKQRKNDPRNKLVYEYFRIVDDIKPEVFVFENVPGILMEKNRVLLESIIEKIEKMNYHYGLDVLNSFDYGVPQNRQRLIIIGRKSGDEIIFPKRSKNYLLKDVIVDLNYNNPTYDVVPIVKKHVSNEEAISDIAYDKVRDSPTPYQKNPMSVYQKELRKFSTEVYNHITTRHRNSSIEIYELLKPGQEMKDLPEDLENTRWTLRRMVPEEIARTLTACNEDFVHYLQNRIITIREMARLQSYPDNYIFYGVRTTGGSHRKQSCCQVQQVANSVPPLLAQAIAEAVLKMLGHKSNGYLKEFIEKLNNRN